MAQLNALRLAGEIRQRLVDFAVDDNYVSDIRLAEICRSIWSGPPEQGGLLSDLWIEGAFPAETALVTLDTLTRSGEFNNELRNQLDRSTAMPRDRRLYTHQYDSFVKAQHRGSDGSRPAIVVTAGTGAGKTEAFLLPILNELYQDPRGNDQGIRCLILYPMNALVNDQVGRLYEWLMGQKKVTLFHFTSETPEDKAAANRLGMPPWDPCRFLTRQQARGLETAHGEKLDPAQRGQVPDVLITNYSMLEYMLCRPQDAVFFGQALRAIVLDEAHLYTGTLAAELTLLLRRVLLRCGLDSRNVLQMATSATLGTGSVLELQQFAAQLFSKNTDLVEVIQGRSRRAELAAVASPPQQLTPELVDKFRIEEPLMEANKKGEQTLVESPEVCDRLRTDLTTLVARETISKAPEHRYPARLLHQTLAAVPEIHHLEDILWRKGRLPLSQLTQELWGNQAQDERCAQLATVKLLNLAASARSDANDYPLVPHRIHLLVRPTEGLTVCLNPRCPGAADRHLLPLGTVWGGFQEHCPACGGAMFSLRRCGNCGTWLLAGLIKQNRIQPAMQWEAAPQYFVAFECAKGVSKVVNSETGEVSGYGAPGAIIWEVEACPHCETAKDDLRPFASGSSLTLSILAETALGGLPEYPNQNNRWLPAGGRRLLAFSDSRQEAAHLGPRLTQQHQLQLVRAAIVHCLEQNLVADPDVVTYYQNEVNRLSEKLVNPSLPMAVRQAVVREKMNKQKELESLLVGGSIEWWASELANQPQLAQILDRATAATHQAASWSQGRWEENYQHVKTRAKDFLAQELARRPNSMEILGVGEVTYPGLESLSLPTELEGRLPTEATRRKLAESWPQLLAALCDTLRSDGVITLGDNESDLNYPRPEFIGKWSASRQAGWQLERFIGETMRQGRRQFAGAVVQQCGVNGADVERWSETILEFAFQQLLNHATPQGVSQSDRTFPWLEKTLREARNGPPANAMRLVFGRLGLRQPLELYRCSITGLLWPRSVQGCAPAPGCFDSLKPVTKEEAEHDARHGWRRGEYRGASVFQIGLWAEEHSAQLDPKENRRLQDLFKAGVRNVLSATTTLELGIDIGGLNAVLMSNVPPGKANYLQRAGRAGRRTDGSSVVVTYARLRPFDLEVFHRVGQYLEQPLRRPLVFLDRERVVHRHFHSFLLGEFFRAVYSPTHRVGAMQAFGNMGVFCGVALPPRWDSAMRAAPPVAAPHLDFEIEGTAKLWWDSTSHNQSLEAQYINYLHWVRDWGEAHLAGSAQQLFAQTKLQDKPDDWAELLNRVVDQFSEAVADWRKEYDQLFESWKGATDRSQANAIRYQLAALYEVTVIEALADRQFLPHYGFPIGVYKLRVIAPDEKARGVIREEDQYRLERGSLLALREYVPGSQLIAGGKLVVSRGLLKHWTGENIDKALGFRGQYTLCVNKHFYYWIAEVSESCPICGGNAESNSRQILFPRNGFTSAAWEPPRWSENLERIGKVQTATLTFTQHNNAQSHQVPNFGEVNGLTARYREDGEILVFNEGDNEQGFAICLRCGYADSESKVGGEKRINLPSRFEDHPKLTSADKWSRCWRPNDSPVLRHQTLAAREVTDVLLLDFAVALQKYLYSQHEVLGTTLGYALQRAGARLLELDSRELGVLLAPGGELGQGVGVVLYDNVPGGAGHVRELLHLGRKWLEETRRVLFVDMAHDTRCETACLDCLLSFEAQDAVAQNLLDRRLALTVLNELLNGNPPPEPPYTSGPMGSPTVGGTGLSLDERKSRARSRVSRRR